MQCILPFFAFTLKKISRVLYRFNFFVICFYRSRVITSGNTRDIFFNLNAKNGKMHAVKITRVFLRANTRDP